MMDNAFKKAVKLNPRFRRVLAARDKHNRIMGAFDNNPFGDR
jgi:hypothetical protein